MSNVIDNAPFAAPLELSDSNAAFFMMRDESNIPATVAIPGSSNLDLQLFNVTATGTVKPSVQGTLILTLYGIAKNDAKTANPADWLPLAATEPESIGGAGELTETMWMVRAEDLMIFVGSRKMQGTFKSNVASSPKPAVDLQQHPRDIDETDPLYIFAVGASFTPSGTRQIARAGTPLCSLTLANFSATD
jgi:hypothetical protein